MKFSLRNTVAALRDALITIMRNFARIFEHSINNDCTSLHPIGVKVSIPEVLDDVDQEYDGFLLNY